MQNQEQFDEPGRYIYIRDNENRDYWSASWQPVGKSLDTYKSECHHGTAYTKMKAVYDGISSEVRYYVPLDQSYEVWNLGITNDSDRERELTVTGYAEFTNNSNYEQDQVNLQYSQFITTGFSDLLGQKPIPGVEKKKNSLADIMDMEIPKGWKTAF